MAFLPFSRPSLGETELSAVREVFASGWITTGPKCAELERAFCQLTGNQHAIAVTSATAGMHVMLMALGIKAGDEVITPSLTWVSTLNIITLLGATPVMIDVDIDNLMVTPEAIEAAITPKNQGRLSLSIMRVRLRIWTRSMLLANAMAFRSLKMPRMRPVPTTKVNTWVASGNAIFSFHAIKNMTCAEGGLVVTDDAALADRIRSLKFHGLGVDAFDRQTHGRQPQAEVIMPGFKYNLPDISAAIALVQLEKLPEINQMSRGDSATLPRCP